jgi:hypothetical protein
VNVGKPKCIFAETLIFNEGWLLRGILEKWRGLKGQSKFPFLPFPKGVKIYSEAQLYTPFKKRSIEDKQGEDNTHVDGIVGNFSLRPNTKSGIDLDGDFKYLAIFEAKMYSELAKGITHVKNYNQVSRTIACIINSVLKVRGSPNNSIYYIITYPNDNKKIESETYTKKFIEGEIEERIKIYKEPKTVKIDGDFDSFEKYWKNVLGKIEVQFVTWDAILDEIKDQDIKRFYDLCKEYNK